MNNIIKRTWNQNRMVNIEDLSGMAFQAEDGGHTFEISGINDAGESVPLSGTVAGVFMRPDLADIAIVGEATDGVVSVTLPADCYAVNGRFALTIFVTSDSQKVAVYAAVGTVTRTSGGAVAGDTPQDVVDLINAINAAVATIPADYSDIMVAVAHTYSNSALYAKGSYAWYDGVLYKAVVDISTAESWTAAHWAAVAIADDVSDLQNTLEQLTSIKTTIQFSDIGNKAIALNMAVGQTVSLTPYQSSSNTWRYAIVPCNAGQKVELNIVGGSTPRAYGFIDENNILLAVANYGAVEGTVIAPENTSKLVLNDNSNGTAYFITSEGRVDALEKEVAELKTKSIDVIVGNNIYDSNKNVYGKMFYESNNNVIWYENQYTTEYTSVIIPVESGYVTFSSDNAGTRLDRYYFTASDTLPTGIISSATPNQYIGTGYTVQVPDGATFMCCSFRNLTENTDMMVNKGQTALPYEPYSIGYYVNGEKIQMESGIDAEYIKTPSKYNLVVGDTFQIFYKGIINAVNLDAFDIVCECSKGQAFEKMFVITPTIAETLNLIVILYDSVTHSELERKTVSLIVDNKGTSPASQKNVLCVGDSLTVGGEWVKEFHRRLTGTGGTPIGDELTNLNFIGTKSVSGVNYEGYGGWTFNSYNTANVTNESKTITCEHDKTNDDQHSIYRASNNSTWKLETIESGSIKIILISGNASTFAADGTLTWVSGGVNHSDIAYTNAVNSPGNPFWNDSTNAVDFADYATRQGVESIDYVVVLLGWNNAGMSEANYKTNAQTFITNLHNSFPNAKVILMGLEIPARDGLAVNYGASGIYSKYFQLMEYVHNLDDWYADLAAENANVYSINVSGQFDTEHNMQTGTRQVNTRNAETEVYQTNGVHPANSGYLQIADAAYRFFTSLI